MLIIRYKHIVIKRLYTFIFRYQYTFQALMCIFKLQRKLADLLANIRVLRISKVFHLLFISQFLHPSISS